MAVAAKRQGYTPENPPPAVPIPIGWRRAKQREITKEILALANERRKKTGLPGTFVQHQTASGPVGTLTEWHYHPPGGALRPWGYHHGITVVVPK